MQRYLFIALGGAAGSLARFLVGSAIANRMGVRFPFGTLIINTSACLIIGFSLELLNRNAGINPAWRYLVPIGFVGAYSTFSTFEWEIFSSLQAGGVSSGLIYIVSSLVLGYAAVFGGFLLARMMS